MSRRRGRWRHAALLALAALYSVFPIYFITVQSLKTPEEDVFGSPLYIVHPTFENYEELFQGAQARVRGYVIVPRVLGHATGLSPLVVLFSVTAVGILFGGFYVLLAIPITAVLATLIDVVVRDVEPSEQDVPAVLFPGAKEEAAP